MLKTYSIKGNTCVVNFSIKTDRSNFAFTAEFTGGDAFGLNGRTRRATYRTEKPMEQFAIEESEMFRRGIVRLDSAVETQKEMEAKARAAARAEKEETAENEETEDTQDVPQSKPKPRTKK